MKFLHGTGLLPTAEELQPLTEDQNLAILEALFLTVIVDGKIEPREVKAFAVQALSFPWNWGPSSAALATTLEALSARLGEIHLGEPGPEEPSARTRERAGSITMLLHLRELGTRIPTVALREKTFAGMFALMISDGELADAEKTAAFGFAKVFGIAEPRAVELVGQVMAALVEAMDAT